VKAPALERTSAAKAGWLVILLTVGWMALVLWPGSTEKPAVKSAVIPLPATSLTRAGLREYTDWDGLPEIFAIWADHAEWQNNRTRFAYWHPVMKDYSYYFEAVRSAKGYRFREIAEPHEPGYFWDESLGGDCPIRFYRPNIAYTTPLADQPSANMRSAEVQVSADHARVELDIAAPNIFNPELKTIPLKAAPKP
jgi:hypothetical protein